MIRIQFKVARMELSNLLLNMMNTLIINKGRVMVVLWLIKWHRLILALIVLP